MRDLMELHEILAEAQRVREQLWNALEYLVAYETDNPPVWVMLWLNEITGCGLRTDCCPVARLISQFVPDCDVRVYDDCVKVEWRKGYFITERLPQPVREFISMFDDGAYPVLVDSNHRHGLLPNPQTS